jgi:Tfp pilus assembly protein PilN
MTASRSSLLLGGAGLALGGCLFDRAYYEKNAQQKAFLDGLQALAKPALASNNPLQIE